MEGLGLMLAGKEKFLYLTVLHSLGNSGLVLCFFTMPYELAQYSSIALALQEKSLLLTS